MACEKCKKFPAPTTAFEKVVISRERHGTLYQCKSCGAYYEIIAGDRSYYELTAEEVKAYYKAGP
jgi:RNase P subunit RPR2